MKLRSMVNASDGFGFAAYLCVRIKIGQSPFCWFINLSTRSRYALVVIIVVLTSLPFLISGRVFLYRVNFSRTAWQFCFVAKKLPHPHFMSQSFSEILTITKMRRKDASIISVNIYIYIHSYCIMIQREACFMTSPAVCVCVFEYGRREIIIIKDGERRLFSDEILAVLRAMFVLFM